jgi:hypothetical protein
MSLIDDVYYCDKCEEEIGHNDCSHEVRYGFICEKCYEEI